MPIPPMSKRVWSDLPPHFLLERILPFLPVPSLLNLRSVCKSWNSYILSPDFLAASSHSSSSSLSPTSSQLPLAECSSFLLLSTWSRDFPLLAFNPSQESWHCPSLDFLEGEEVVYSVVAAAGGLLCLGDGDGSFVVCNPVTKAKKTIKMVAGGERTPRNVVLTCLRTYREEGVSRFDIVVVGSCEGSKQDTWLYESSRGNWRICEKNSSDMLFFESGAVFHGTDLLVIASFPSRLMAFSVLSASWREHAAVLPQNLLFPCVVDNAGSLILLAAVEDAGDGVYEADFQPQISSFKLWKLDEEANAWHEIASLPGSMLSHVVKSGHFEGFHCVSRGHLVHLNSSEGCLVYDSFLQAWSWLPESKQLSELHACIKDVYALEPTLDCLVTCST